MSDNEEKKKHGKQYARGFMDGFDHAVTNLTLYFNDHEGEERTINDLSETILTLMKKKKLESESAFYAD